MSIIYFDAQGNKTTDLSKAVRSVTDNPGTEGDVSTNIISQDRIFKLRDGDILFIRDGKRFPLNLGNPTKNEGFINNLGIDFDKLPTFSSDINLPKGGELTGDEFTKEFKSGKIGIATTEQDLTTGAQAKGATSGDIPQAPTGDFKTTATRDTQTSPSGAFINSDGNIQLANGQIISKEDKNTFNTILKEEGLTAPTTTQDTTGDPNELIQITKGNANLTVTRQSFIDNFQPEGFTESGTTTTPTTKTEAVEGEVVDDDFQRQLNNLLSSSGLPTEIQDLIREIVTRLPVESDGSDEEILKVFNELSSQIIDPFFAELITTAKRDIEINIARREEDFDKLQELQTEQAEERVRQGQLSLEARGLTRSGENVRQLGKEGFFGEQSPLEGFIPTGNRRIAESSRSQFKRGIEDVGLAGEQLLGSGNLPDISGFTPRGGVTGQIPFQKEAAKANLLGNLSNQQGLLDRFRAQFF